MDEHLRVACDTHTHTIYSRHAYSTIEECVRAASERGLELLGSTDHYSAMLSTTLDVRDFQFYINRVCWPREWHGVRLLRGCEADIVDLEGHLFGHDLMLTTSIVGSHMPPISLKDEVFRDCDYVIASVHNLEPMDGCTPAEGTAMYEAALADPKVLILGHIGRAGVPFEVAPLVRAAGEAHKLVEVNEHPFDRHDERVEALCRRLAECCAEEGTGIVVNSDAHISCDIGRLDRSIAMLEEIHFPQELIANRSADAFESALADAGLGLR